MACSAQTNRRAAIVARMGGNALNLTLGARFRIGTDPREGRSYRASVGGFNWDMQLGRAHDRQPPDHVTLSQIDQISAEAAASPTLVHRRSA